MLVRQRSASRLAFLLLVSSTPGCEEEPPEHDPQSEQDDEDAELEEADVCIEGCNPVKQNCEAGDSCLPANPGFTCQELTAVTDGTRRGLYDACEVGSQTCDAGLVCLQVAVPGCTGGTGCCTVFCDINTPECTDGTMCYPVFEASQMCYPNVGVCVLY
jgi:hypothetical protein